MGKVKKYVISEERYNCILFKERSVYKRIKDILDTYYKQKNLKKRGMKNLQPFTEIVLNNLPPYLKYEPSEWLAFVEKYLEKRRKEKKLRQQEEAAKKESKNRKQIVNNKPRVGVQCTIQFV